MSDNINTKLVMDQKTVGFVTISTYSAISTYSIEVPDVRTASELIHNIYILSASLVICKRRSLLDCMLLSAVSSFLQML